MKIVYISNSGQPGGVEQHLLDLVRGMVSFGYEVVVVCPNGPMAEAYAAAGARLAIDAPKLDVDPGYIWRLTRLLRRERPDICHAHQLKTVVNGLIAAKLAGVPAKIAHIHTPLAEWPIPVWKKRIDIFVNRLVSNWGADVVLALTKSVRETRIRTEGIKAEKIVVIPNGIDLNAFRIGNRDAARKELRAQLGLAEDAVAVGTLGRLTIEKGHRFLLEALPLLNSKLGSRNSALKVVIAGDGELREVLINQARELEVADRVTFLGFVPEDKKLAYLTALDIFVFPSLAEGFGIALIEAMATGGACLVSDLPVLVEVGGSAVMSFRVGNVSDLAYKLAEMVASPQIRSALGQAARERVEKEFTLEKFWGRYRKLYENLILGSISEIIA